MHTFLYPQKDTYITNEVGYVNKNFGIDEILELKAHPNVTRTAIYYQSSSISQSVYTNLELNNFTGNISGSNTSIDSSGYANLKFIANSSISFTGSLINGANITGSLSGVVSTSSFLNGTTYGSSGQQSVILSNISGSLNGFSGSFVGSLTVTSSLIGNFTGSINNASGSLNNFYGCISGFVYGTQSLYNPYFTYIDVPDYSRILIKFDVTEISKSISNGSITSDVTFKLKLKTTQASELPVDYTVYGYPISQSWNMGIGRFSTGGDLVGASWNNKNESGSLWYISGSNITTGTSASINEGGTWYNTVPLTYQYNSSSFCTSSFTGSSLICSQSYGYTTSDINMDITNIVKGWICGCVPNEGVILISSLESSTINGIDSTVKFFSKETNTIYQPYIDISWNDSIYTTGSMVPLTGIVPYTVVMQNLSKEYKFGSIPRINIFAREKFPLKNFTKGYQQNSYLSSSLLPSASYYCIKDNESENIVIDFDDNTKLSSDGNIHYFKIDTTGLPVERFYRILIKTTFDNQTDIFDNGNIFKITR
jgi:hypothetical protein